MPYTDELQRIQTALAEAQALVTERFTPGEVDARKKSGGDPVTEADTQIDTLLKRLLPRGEEGWLSEETLDDKTRLDSRRVWVVDPLDGTKEFVMGLPEWSISVGLVEDGEAVAGGICNPATGETILGARGHGVTLNGQPVSLSQRPRLEGAEVLASRSEVTKGQWKGWDGAPYTIRAMGSVAYKLGRVAAGLSDATWTLVPKHEWDVAAGVALVLAAGGKIVAGTPEQERFNRPHPKLTSLIAAPPQLMPEILEEIARRG
ncbi:MAG TPA: 3'(2'),5'-bisphosphate nucleotidase CysQ [Thermoanaerobaculia bacterium]|nr:3'(2'),5'-bisphosphate nucleotidase CysQ [Thermoanaerobaculia bacterium]